MNHILPQVKQINLFNGDPLHLALFVELFYHYCTILKAQNLITYTGIRNLQEG